MWWAISISVIFIFILVLSLCKAAGDADRNMERLKEQLQKEKELELLNKSEENHKWCDDFCLRCDMNDWCWFSEVKNNKHTKE